ncbi:P-loop containing nucleoside triphosphate hydrolase protein [Hyaloraphidium curvatum]|nr:P-loop containing nucleoside triphosphate hydrolase protein [Hyaloraphidium curvatum]
MMDEKDIRSRKGGRPARAAQRVPPDVNSSLGESHPAQPSCAADEARDSGAMSHRLESSTNAQPGGLYVRSKPSGSSDERPRTSMLGLDRLAEQKRQEREDAAGRDAAAKRVKLDSTGGWEGTGDGAGGDDAVFKKPLPVSGNYRLARPETPSAPGGVSDAARERMWEHQKDKKGFRAGGLVNRSRLNEPDGGDSEPTGGPPVDKGPVAALRRSEWDETPSAGSPTLVGSTRGASPRRDWPETRSTALSKGRSEWDATPRVQASGYGSDDPRSHLPDAFVPDSEDDYRRWEDEQNQVDRDWYDGEEGTAAVDEMHNPFAEFEDFAKAREEEMAKAQVKKVSARQQQYNRDNDLWETNRMLQSGLVQRKAVDMQFEEEDESRVHILIRDIKPPFLDGKTVYTKQLEPVNPIKDPTSDLAVFSRKGSRLVAEKRTQQERAKAAKSLNVAGSNLGNIMGVKSEETEEDKSAVPTLVKPPSRKGDEDRDDYQGDSKYSASMMEKSEAVSQFAMSKTIREQRQYLPAFAVREELLRVIRDNQIVVVVGETGSGKTTQLTQYLAEDGYATNGMIGCTQPRRVAAMSVAKRVSEEMNCKLGSKVGYSIRFEDCTSKETIIKYMTDGVLLRESLTSKDLDQYSAIIMDEAHERSLNTDVLMGLIKLVVARRRDLKLIVTSATMNADKFSSFFGNVPIFTIPGRTFPVDVMFSKTPQEDYVDAAVKQTLAIHLSHPPGDILVFMTGQEDIEVTCAVLADRLAQIDDAAPLAILPIYSQLPADLQAKIFEKAPNNARKVIVATNIAETSLTVDGIIYVVDSGYY